VAARQMQNVISESKGRIDRKEKNGEIRFLG